MKEIWKDIGILKGIDFTDHYQISNLGRIKSLERWLDNGKWGGYLLKERILANWKNQFGYYLITLSVENRKRHFLIHKLIAIFFIPNPLNKPFVNHINGNKADYSISNLEWCTREENDRHAIAIGLRINSGYRKKVKIYKDEIELYFDSAYSAADYIGCSRGGVNQVANPNNRHKIIFGWKAEFL